VVGDLCDQTKASAANATPTLRALASARALRSISTARVTGSRVKRHRFLFLVADCMTTPFANTLRRFPRPSNVAV
jgi:hypothetical protein